MMDMTGRYVIVRSQSPQTMPHTGVQVPGWDSLASVMFDDLADAREFAGRLDDATVYRLEAVR